MKVLKNIFTALASLRITVVLLAAAVLLVYAGTLAQRQQGIWEVVETYFRSWVVYIPFKNLIPFVNPDRIGFGFLFPGGYSLIVAILINLLAAHSLRFKFKKADFFLLPLIVATGYVTVLTQQTPTLFYVTLCSLLGVVALVLICLIHKKRAGVIIIHLALILLLIGEGITGEFAKEGQMPITEGESSNWVQDIRSVELAIVDTSDANVDKHVVISGERLAQGGTITDPRLPFDLRVDRFNWNTELAGPQNPKSKDNMLGTVAPGKNIALLPADRVSGTEMQKTDLTTGFVTPITKDGKALDTYLVTVPLLMEPMLQKLNDPQPVEVGGKRYGIQLRYERSFRPFSIHLFDFTHDKFEGTDVARNYASQVRLTDAAKGVQRDVTIKMNEPLRYGGETFFQASFMGEKTTILQVVKNPGWLMPYIACGVGALGMLIHFGIVLVNFLIKRAKAPTIQPGIVLPPPIKPGKGRKADPAGGYALPPLAGQWPMASKLLPLGLAIFAVIYIIGHAFQGSYESKQTPASRLDLTSFANIPVSFDGRVMPIDSVARGNLKILSNKETTTGGWDTEVESDDGKGRVQAVEWLADTLAANKRGDTYKTFRIDHPELKSLLGLSEEEKVFSWKEIADKPGNMNKLQEQVNQVRKTPANLHSSYQKAVGKLYQHFTRYLRLTNAVEQSVLFDTLADEKKGVTLLASALQAGVFLSPNTRSDEQHQMIFGNPMLRQLDRTVNYLGSDGGRGDNLLFIPPLAPNERWQPLARVTVSQLREATQKLRNVFVHDPARAGIVEHLDSIDQKFIESDAMLGENSVMSPAQAEVAKTWFTMLRQLRNDDVAGFNTTVANYQKTAKMQSPQAAKANVGFEVGFNRFDPFTVSAAFYIAVLVLALASMVGFTRPFWRSAMLLLIIALFVHSYGLIARMYISGRPPVTNLYSSAIFIGWGSAVFCLILEAIYRNGIGFVTAGVVGFATTLIAGALDVRDTDTMAQLQAVLDTNWWLATHVVIITLGYSACFVAGIIATVFIIMGMFSRGFDATSRKEMYRMVYGIVCFAMFASFVGTILGGIWADQSWGRFWGWDPKENGAILIVLWMAVILHARWGGLVKERGFMVLTILGINVTSWSWFGTNLMGVGLHAYGFIEGGAIALVASWIFFWIVTFFGSVIPKSMWRSYGFEASLPVAKAIAKPPKIAQAVPATGA